MRSDRLSLTLAVAAAAASAFLVPVAPLAAAWTSPVQQDFSSTPVGGDPAGWFDTPGHLPHLEWPALYKVVTDPRNGANRVFGTSSPLEAMSHYRGESFASSRPFGFTGRMLREHQTSEVGITFFSAGPNGRSFYWLGQGLLGNVQVLAVGSGPAGQLSGDRTAGLRMDPNRWLRFRVLAEPEGARGLRLRARVWYDGSPEPSSWAIDARSTRRLDAGLVGVWGRLPGKKAFDDLVASKDAVSGDTDPPTIVVRESGAPLDDGKAFARDVTPTFEASDASGIASLSATLDGASAVSGQVVSSEGTHVLAVVAVDGLGNRAERVVGFSIDRTPPQFGAVSPPTGTVTAAATVSLSGTVSGALSLTVDGAVVLLDGNQFTAGPFPLTEGGRTFLLVATDAAGNTTERLQAIVRDSTPPAITVSEPSAPVVGTTPIAVGGTASDAHLAEVRVGGRLATLDGVSFRLEGVVLQRGENQLQIYAVDTVGNASSSTLRVTLDDVAPLVEILEGGAPLEDGLITRASIRPVVRVTDAGEVTTDVRLDGQPFTSGSLVDDEGAHEIVARATDQAGQSAEQLRHFTIDRTPPVFVAVRPAFGTMVDGAAAVIEGEVDGATRVEVNGSSVSFDGHTFRSPSLPLLDGETTFQLAASDFAGNRSDLAHKLLRDASPPEIQVDEPLAGALLRSETVVVRGAARDPRLREVRVAGQVATLVGEQFISPPIALTEGDNVLVVEAFDAAGNRSEVRRSVILDSEPPTLRILEAGVPLLEGAVFARVVRPVVEASDPHGAAVDLRLDGSPLALGAAIDADGPHELSVRARDEAGNEVTETRRFEIDRTAPSFANLAPADGTITRLEEIVLEGDVNGATEVTVEGAAPVRAGDHFRAGPFPLSEGQNLLHLVAVDAAGNRTERSWRVLRDRQPPQVVVTAPAEGTLLGTRTVTVTGTVDDTGAGSATRRVEVAGVTAVVSGRTFVASQVSLAEGDNSIRVVAEDGAGNRAEVLRGVVSDTVAPTIAIGDPARGTIASEASLEISGTVDDDHLDRVEVAGARATLTPAGPGSPGRFRATAPLRAGANTIVARAVDRAGNRREVSVDVMRDAEAPSLTIDQPLDGSSIRTPTVEVRGHLSGEETATVTVAGEAVSLVAGSFVVPALPLVEGENRIVVRARDAAGNEAVRVRQVFRDTQSPRLERADPMDGAEGLRQDAVFRLTLSESPGVAPPGTIRLSRVGSPVNSPIEVAVTTEGPVITARPVSALPADATLSLEVTAGVVDPAGNALANPQALHYRTADSASPEPPRLDPASPASRLDPEADGEVLSLCGPSITLRGSVEAGARVRASGGAGLAETVANGEGRFELAVPLLPNRLNALEVVATDPWGNVSAPTRVAVIHDCEAPFVTSSRRQGDRLSAVFSEPVLAATVSSASVRATGAAGSLVGSVALATDRRSVELTLVNPPSGAIRFEVTTEITDTAGNALRYPFSKVFAVSSGDSFFEGTVIDDSTGRPLEGASVLVLLSNGVVTPEPVPSQTTSADGEFSLPVDVGTHLVAIRRVGMTPAFRSVTTAAGQGSDVLDPRLTPFGAVARLGSAGGSLVVPSVGAASPALHVPAGALSDERSVAWASLSPQALPALLPLGWSARAAAWVELENGNFGTPATLVLPVNASGQLVVAQLDLVTLQWTAIGSVEVEAGRVVIPVPSWGAYAVVVPDQGPTAPPPAQPGQVLGAPANGSFGAVVGATIEFTPESVLPTQTAEGLVTFVLSGPVPSGLPLTLSIVEEFETLDGAIVRQAPYRADVVTVSAGDAAREARFRLQASRSARLLPVRLGAEDVTLHPFDDLGVRGNVLGPSGGVASNDEGDTLEVPFGALSEPTPIVLRRFEPPFDEGDLGFVLPAGFEVVGLIEVDLAGRRLDSAALLHFASASGSGELLVGRPVGSPDGFESGLEAVGRAAFDLGRYRMQSPDALGLPWPGIREGGRYVFVRWLDPHGFVTGAVRDVGGAALGDARVSAMGGPWRARSTESGTYVVPIAVGVTSLVGTHATSGNRATATVSLEFADTRLERDLQLQAVGPEIVASVPSDGATQVLPAIEPTVRFSETVEPSSLADGVTLWLDGVRVSATVTAQGSLARLIPAASLRPGAAYELRVGTEVRDLEGFQLEHPVTIHFVTARILTSDEIDLSRIDLIEPDASGRIRVVGRAGAVPSGALVFVENTTSYASTPSTDASPTGAFSLEIQGTTRDILLLHVVVTGSNEVIAELGPFLSTDRRSALAKAGSSARFTTADGVLVSVPAGAFSGDTWVGLSPDPSAPAAPEVFDALLSFVLDTQGQDARKPLHLEVPAPASLPAGDLFWNRQVDARGEPAWMLHALAQRVGDRLATLDPDPAAALASQPSGGPTVRLMTSPAAADGEAEATTATAPPQNYTPGIVFPGRYQLVRALSPLSYLALPLLGGATDLLVTNDVTDMVAMLDARLALHVPAGGILIPTVANQSFTLQGYDLDSGYRLFDQQFAAPAPSQPGAPIPVLPPDTYGDTAPPLPIGGAPLQFALVEAKEGATTIGPSVRATFDAGALIVEGDAGSTAAESRVELFAVGSDVRQFVQSAANGSFSRSATSSPNQKWVLVIGATVEPSEPLVLVFSEGVGTISGAAAGRDVAGIDVVDAEGRLAPIEIWPRGGRDVLEIRPQPTWRAGATYTLRLRPDLVDGSGNALGQTIEGRFVVTRAQVLPRYPVADDVRDVARLGSWLFVAGDAKGLVLVDASNPNQLKGVVPGDVTFPLGFEDPVSGVAVDSHGRVIYVGGGLQNFGVLKIFDPLRLDPIALGADPGNAALRQAPQHGTTPITDPPAWFGTPSDTSLPDGRPGKVSVVSEDLTDRWRLGSALPVGLTLVPSTLPASGEVRITVSGSGGQVGLPVTLRNLTRGRFDRVDAGADGVFSVSIDAAPGDELELLRNQSSLAYVATLGVGIQVVDVNAVWRDGGADVPSSFVSRLIGGFDGRNNPPFTLCGEPQQDLGFLMDVDTMVRGSANPPLTVFGLVGVKGPAVFESPVNNPGAIALRGELCTEIQGSRAVSGLATLPQFVFDPATSTEPRDYILVVHRVGGVLVVDVTDRNDPHLVGRYWVPGQASQATVDATARKLYVSTAGGEVSVFDLGTKHTLLQAPDANGDGIDDRRIETIQLGGGSVTRVFLVPEVGLAFTGALDHGLTGVAVGGPRLVALSAEVASQEGPALDQDGVPIAALAPYGVPSAIGGGAGSFRVKAWLPGFVGGEFRLVVRSLAGGGGTIDGLGREGIEAPPVELSGPQGLVLRRLAARGFEEGSQWFLSEPVSVVADPRAAGAFVRTPREIDQCTRCEPSLRPAGARELLAGETIAVEWNPSLLTQLSSVYGPERVKESQLRIPSVRWEVSPSTRQEPSRQVSTGTGDVIPGTLLHSGEVTQSAVDASLPGRGIPVAFARTYRNQTIGAGPLGPGWDHNYRMRLRALPNGDVELYDGRGRRETFEFEATGALKAPAGWFVELKRLSSGFELILTDHSTIRFDDHGRMVALRDRLKIADDAGNELRFRHDASDRLTAIEDDLGQLHRLTYDAEGRLTRFTDATGREWKYGYSLDGLLETVTTPALTVGESTFPAGLETRYEYQPPSGTLAQRLTSRDDLRSITDPRGLRPVEWDYTDADADGRAEEVTTERWGGKPLGIVYRFAEGEAEVLDRVGETRVYGHDSAGRLLRVVDPLDHVASFTLDDEGLVTQSVAPLGRVTGLFYDQSGRRRSRGNVLRSEVDADDRGPNGSSARLATRFEYEVYSNQPIQSIDPRGTATAILRDGVGQVLTVTEGFGTPVAGTTRYEYDAFGRLTKTTDPTNVISSVEYGPGSSGRGQSVRTIDDPQGHALESRVERNARGDVIATIDGRGVRDETVRNELGWVVEERQAVTSSNDGAPALGYVTRHRHDAVGQVVETKSPFGDTGLDFTRSQTDYGVLGEVLASRSEINPYTGPFVETRRVYDDAFRLIRIEAPEGQLTEQEYDERGLLSVVRRGVGSVDQTSESFLYDAEGQRTHATDGLNNTSVTVYDGYGRVEESIDPLGHRTHLEYDDGGNVVKTEALHSSGNVLARTVTVHDERGRAIRTRNALMDPEGPGTTRDVVNSVVYDPASRTIQSVDARGHSTTIERDSAGRVVVVIDGAGNRQQVTRDENSNPIEIVSVEVLPAESGTVEVRETAKYDALGRVIEARDGLGNPNETRYDAQGNVRFQIDAEGFFTESEYDGLGRRVRETRPEGITVEYGYDRSGRPTSYRDALGNVTTWQYDALDRKTQTTYPDNRIEQMAYDAAGNLREHRDANGNRVAQTYDAANRLTARTVVRGAGVEGPAAEAFDYDGLGRLVRAQSGDVVVDRVYDSLSRMTEETSGGRTIQFQHDDSGNPVETTFSNGSKSIRTFDALDRIATIQNAATNSYRGPGLLQRQALGNGLTAGRSFDGARRPTQTVVQEGGVESFSEKLNWSPRNLKVSQIRGDQADRGLSFRYDAATRLTEMARADVSAVANNTIPASATGASDRFAFEYDAAENLLARKTAERGIEEVLPLPLDASGRNRPGAAGSTDLDWGPNGNLTSKGDLEIAYDYRNRPVRVSRDGQEVASYQYDAFNRRVSATHGGATTETVWNGWQDLETHENGQLVSRRQFGAGLDEIVRQDVDLDGDGTLESQQYPLYDSIGNLTTLTDAQGRTVERYEYTPYGEQTIRVDSAPPKVDSVTVRAGVVEVLFSEAVSELALTRAFSGGQASLVQVADSTPVALEVDQPQVIGRNAGRRVLLRIGSAPAAGTQLRLRFEPEAVVDTFQKTMDTIFEASFPWSVDQVVIDATAPRVLEVRAKGGKLEVEFSEEIAAAQAASTIRIDDQPLAWQLSDDRFTVISTTAVSIGAHRLTIPTTLADPTGNALAESLDQDFALGAADRFVYRAPEPDVAAESTAMNRFGFHGRDRDPATGWVYMRNRWYDPELGRFVSQDPLGYVDGPSATAFAGNGPVNSTDPLGLYEEDVHQFLTWFLARAAGFPEELAYWIGSETEALDRDYRSAMHGGVSQVNMANYHFVTREQLRVLQAKARESVPLDMISFRRIGEYLHALEDSYSHQRGQQERQFGNYYRGLAGPQWNSFHIGHGFEGHEPDWTWRRPVLSMAMARDVYDELVLLCAMRFKKCSPKPFGTIEGQVFAFVSAEPGLFPEAEFPLLMGVSDYSEKIRILDPTFVVEAPERGRLLRFKAYRERERRMSIYRAGHQGRMSRQ